jgi:hypothetical protein
VTRCSFRCGALPDGGAGGSETFQSKTTGSTLGRVLLAVNTFVPIRDGLPASTAVIVNVVVPRSWTVTAE